MEFKITSPEGKEYNITAPEGTTEQQAFEMLQASLGETKVPEPSPAGKDRGFISEAGEVVTDTAGLARSALAGMAGVPGGIAQYGAEVVENLIALPGYLASKARGEEPEPTDTTVSDWIERHNEYLKGMIRPEKMGPYDRLVEKLAEYAVPTAAATQAFIKAGKSLKELEVFIKFSPQEIGAIESTLMQYAKDPKAAHAMEQSISAAMATAGEIAQEYGFDWTGQMGAELAAGILTGGIINNPTSIYNWMRSFGGKAKAADYFRQISDADPEFAKKLQRGLELQERTGIKMDLGELTNNPELKAMAQALLAERAGAWTAADMRLKEQTKRIERAFPIDKKAERVAQDKALAAREKTVSGLEKEAADSISKIMDEVNKVAPIDRFQAGETGRVMLQNAREEAQSRINKLYADIGNPELNTNIIKDAINKVKKTELKGYDFKGMMDPSTQKIIETNFGAKSPKKQTLGAIRELEEMVGREISLARLANDPQKVRMFSLILSGIRAQYREAKGLAQVDAQKLRSAARASKKMHDLFDQGDVLLASKVGAQNIERISTADFINLFVKPNSLSRTANIEKGVNDFLNAYGDVKEARQYLSNAFGALMREQLGDNPKPVEVQRFIKKYSRFLDAAKIKDNFDSVGKATKQAEIADINLVADQKEFKKTVMKRFLETGDPSAFVINQVKNGKIGKLMREIDKIPNKSERRLIRSGINEMMWDAIQKEMTTTQNIDDVMLMTTGGIRQTLKSYSDDFSIALGRKHAKQLNDLLDIVDRVSPVTGGAKLDELDPKLVEKAFTGLRAAAHGFVRPDLIAAQLGMRGIKAFREATARKIMREAMVNPEFAEQLIELSKSKDGRVIISAMFAPLSVTPSMGIVEE